MTTRTPSSDDAAGPRTEGGGVADRSASSPWDEVRWPLLTERLTLRPAREADAHGTWLYRRLPEVARWITDLPTDGEVYRTKFADPQRLRSTVIVERDGRLVGDLMLRLEDAWAQAEVAEQARNTQAELGWVLDPADTGRGYATEAVAELIRCCFEDLHLRRVTANCFLENEASWRLMERVGMRRETHAVADSLHRDGRWLDTLNYAILADEYGSAGTASEDSAHR